MFFVISGFCITAAARSAARKSGVGAFLYRRLRRIYPPYWASVVAVAVVPFVIELISAVKTGHFEAPSRSNLNFGYLNYSISDWLAVLSLVQVFASDPAATSLQYKFTTINAVYWTLAIEVQFYVVLTVAVALRSFFYPFLIAVTVVSIPFAMDPLAYRSGIFLPYWPMFGVGVMVWYVFERRLAPLEILGSRAATVGGLGLGLLGGGFLVTVARGGTVGSMAFALLFGGIVYLAHGLEPAFQRMTNVTTGVFGLVLRTGLLLGAMSYTVYLIHGRVQFLALQFVRQVVRDPSIIGDVCVFVVTLLLCYPFYRFFERPFVGDPRK